MNLKLTGDQIDFMRHALANGPICCYLPSHKSLIELLDMGLLEITDGLGEVTTTLEATQFAVRYFYQKDGSIDPMFLGTQAVYLVWQVDSRVKVLKLATDKEEKAHEYFYYSGKVFLSIEKRFLNAPQLAGDIVNPDRFAADQYHQKRLDDHGAEVKARDLKQTEEFLERGYCSLPDSATDSAYGVFFHEDGLLVGVHIGPGFNPDGSNTIGWIWGGIKYWQDDAYPDMAQWMEKWLSGNIEHDGGNPIEYLPELTIHQGSDAEEPFWYDKERVLAMMKKVINEEF